ncbi:BamA/TamA family outer membrane protein [Colwellia sp. TT2012]|uniref:BamA/TamA family outer membrane protein n=1 Tax=Colwellia sp. TT2012 TaxID=1720342 RepID=UPI000708FC3D|nr:BamA/TamA family outer membrane protein [Colwellia sp. TT2012]
MQFLLAAITKIKECHVLSPTPIKNIPLIWRDNAITSLPSLFMAGLLTAALCGAVSAAEQVAKQAAEPVKNTSSSATASHNYSVSKQTAEKSAIEAVNEAILCNSNQPKIRFNPQTIFDENEEGITFLHRWANAIHIDTKIVTLENEASFFINKCIKTFADMAELERHLRSRKYLRDAKVSRDDGRENITITTWDNWSLMPTVSFGRKGGINTYSFGIKESNLLGLGIDTEVEAYRNTQRSGYKLLATIPLFQKQNTEVKLRFADNDDGQQYSLFLHKMFAGFHTKTAYNLGFNEESRNDTLFQNGQDQSIYRHDISFKAVNYAWLNFNSDSRLLRYRVGITQDKNTFSALTSEHYNDLTVPSLTNVRPEDRDLLYPWFAFEYIEKDFRKLTNVHLITQIEDFNHGWQLNSRLGIGNGNKENAAWTIWNMRIKKGFNLHNNALLLLDFALANDIYQHRDSRLLVKLTAEYFYQLNQRWGFYLSNTNVASKNQYLDKPVTMGGNTGLRGFPLQYQHGKSSIKATAEIRYYPQINLFKLFDLAAVAFVDAGRTYGESTVKNIEEGWLGSVGLGLRLHSPHSGGNHPIIHIDFALPQSDNPTINSFEIRVQAKKSF